MTALGRGCVKTLDPACYTPISLGSFLAADQLGAVEADLATFERQKIERLRFHTASANSGHSRALLKCLVRADQDRLREFESESTYQARERRFGSCVIGRCTLPGRDPDRNTQVTLAQRSVCR